MRPASVDLSPLRPFCRPSAQAQTRLSVRLAHVGLLLWSASFGWTAPASADTLHVPGTFGTIQAALNAASNGDTVQVAAGFYVENVVLPNGIDLVLQGAGAGSTTIDGANANSVVRIQGGQTRSTVVAGFTIQNGSATHGGGLFISNASPTIQDCTIQMNTASSAGGGIKVTGSAANPLIRRSVVQDNTSTDNGAGIHVTDSTAEILDNEFLDNTVLASMNSSGAGVKVNFTTAPVLISGNLIEGNSAEFAGGGISAFAGEATILDNVVKGNSAPNGGGLHLESQIGNGGDLDYVVTGNCIEGNMATAQGGGIHTFLEGTASTMEISNNRIANNTCFQDGCDNVVGIGCCRGGGISAIGGTLQHMVTGNSFYGNTADIFGAGLFDNASADPESMLLLFQGNEVAENRSGWNYPGINCVETVECEILGNSFSGNLTDPEPSDHNSLRNPGALYLVRNDTVNIENNFFFENMGSLAGAIQIVEGTEDSRIVNNTFAANLAGSTSGATIRVESSATIVNNIFDGDRYGIRVNGAPTVDVRNNNFQSQSSGVFTGGPTHTTVAGLNGESFASGNLALSPGFVNPVADLYRLDAGSAIQNEAICAVAPIDDFDGEARPHLGGCDIGADEFHSGTALPNWPAECGGIFMDGFESGNTSRWSTTVP